MVLIQYVVWIHKPLQPQFNWLYLKLVLMTFEVFLIKPPYSTEKNTEMSQNLYDFGMIGLGTMGRNCILNVADDCFSAIGLDKAEEQVAALQLEGVDHNVEATTDTAEFVQKLARPRKIMLFCSAMHLYACECVFLQSLCRIVPFISNLHENSKAGVGWFGNVVSTL